MQNIVERPWYTWVRRWGQTNLTEDDPARNNIDFWRAQWKRTRVQGVIVNCGGIVAYYPSKYGLQYRANTLGDKDYFKAFADAAHEEGLIVVARMDLSLATEEFYKAHPDWFCVDKNGEPYKSMDRCYSCVNGDYYKKYIPDVLTEIIEKYHPAGFADNSWRGMFRDKICYCERCRQLFFERTGRSLPEKADMEDPLYREWVRWSYESRTENWDLFNDTTRRKGGENCLWLGMLHANPYDVSDLSGALSDLKAILNRSKFIFSDQQSRVTLGGFMQNAVNGSLLRLAAEEDVIVAESMANYVRGKRSFRLAANPPQETRMWMVSGLAGGVSPWFHHVSGATYDRRQFETPVSFMNWHAENEEWFYNRRSLATVGVVWNQANTDFYGRNKPKERVAYPWYGFTQALSEMRIPFLPIHIDDIVRYQGRIKTLVLPDMAVMSGKQRDAIYQFADNGGGLVFSGITGILNEDGEPDHGSRFFEHFGLRLTGKTYGEFTEQPASWDNMQVHNYMHLHKDRHPILDGFEDTEIIALGGGLNETESFGPLALIAGYVKPFPIYPPEFSFIREIDDGIASMFAGTLPSGARVVYLAADIDRCYGRERLPDHATLLSNAVCWTLHGKLPVKVLGEGKIDVNIYQKEQTIVLHLVNLSGCDENPGYCHRTLPVHGIGVTLPIAGRVLSIDLTVSGDTIPFRVRNGQLSFTIPRITDHEVVIIKA
jgi:hypothetical protein